MVIYGVYEDDEYQECRFVGTADEISKEFGITNESFRSGLQKAPKGKESTSSKRVKQYDLEGNLIKIWDCTMDIQRELCIANQYISACCLGKKKTSHSYVWRYADE